MLTLALFASFSTATHIWPSPQLDALEALRWDQDRNGITGLVEPCDFFLFGPQNTGRSNAADWIRTAYHDMATHNSADGTGGMDASIRFTEEQARPEDAGTGFDNTVRVLQRLSTRYISIADTLAVGAILAIENCAGSEIAFRGGRVDATEPNLPGVPEPQQDLDSHIASFARQGFTQIEMIGLVACGHTFGGVEHGAFPNIVPDLNDTNNVRSVAHFDTTNTQFDNKIATEYISGTTQNPLVVGFNDKTNSDKRIFGSDGNVTMRSFANSPDLFTSTCADLFARMIDTVPAGVQLTEVITPLPVKPQNIILLFAGDTIQFSGEVRLWDLTPDADPIVRLLWDDRAGATNNNVTIVQASVVPISGGRHNATWYVFTQNTNPALGSLDPAAGITSIRFTVNNKLEDQGGVGFAIQDDIMFAASSCFTANINGDIGTLDVAVSARGRKPLARVSRGALDSITGLPTIVEIDLTPQPVTANATYAIWRITKLPPFVSYTIGAEIDGVKVTRGLLTSAFEFGQCQL
ncbi:heme peroxidase [Mycena leptocephala]|nr:heme peroxidase [Mycena leptocephala]